MRALGLHAEEIGPLWWLSTNPAVASSSYRWIIAVLFVVAFPLTILARTIATSAIALLCCKHPSTPGESLPHHFCIVQGRGSSYSIIVDWQLVYLFFVNFLYKVLIVSM